MAARNPSRLALCLLALAGTGATCSSAQKPQPAATAAPDAGPPQVLRTVDGGIRDVDSDLPTPTAQDLPGYPLDQVLPSLARQIFAFAQDAFSYDGCPTPLSECLKQPQYQRHALRMLALATRQAAAGAKNVEIATSLNNYYASFAPSERKPVSVDAQMCRGPADAKVTVAEFSDFECPYCGMARPLLEGLVTEGGPVRLCFKPFPLEKVHPHALAAAEAGYFARAQGKFWELHDLMFSHQEALELADLKRYAADAELDPGQLERAVEGRAFAPLIEASQEEGHRAGVHGTPTLFLNGRKFDLPLTQENLVQAIDDELEWQSNGGKWASR